VTGTHGDIEHLVLQEIVVNECVAEIYKVNLSSHQGDISLTVTLIRIWPLIPHNFHIYTSRLCPFHFVYRWWFSLVSGMIECRPKASIYAIPSTVDLKFATDTIFNASILFPG
jgi:hypothetical protein